MQRLCLYPREYSEFVVEMTFKEELLKDLHGDIYLRRLNFV